MPALYHSGLLKEHELVLTTERFSAFHYEEAETLGHRILSLPFVTEVDWMHGFITVAVGSDWYGMVAKLATIEKHLLAPIAEGEHVEEIFHEWGKTVYTYEYVQGEYDNGGDW